MTVAAGLAKQSDSTIIVLLIVVAVIIVALIPVIKTVASIETSKRTQDYEREGRLIQVVEKNTEVNTALKTLIETGNQQCETCRMEQSGSFRKVFDNQEITNMKLTEIATTLGIEKGEK